MPGAKTISKGGISHIGQDLDSELVHAGPESNLFPVPPRQ